MKPGDKVPPYSYFIRWSQEDKEFVATFLELPDLSGLGPTVAEAIHELNEAAGAWIVAAREKGFEIPEPLPSQRGSQPLVILDRSLQGEDPVVADLAWVLPPEIKPQGEPKVGETGAAEGVPLRFATQAA